MSTQPIPTFPLGYEYLEDKPVDKVISILLDDDVFMNTYTQVWWDTFAQNAISSKDKIVSEPSKHPLVNAIWKFALEQDDLVYAGKLFFICGMLP